MKAFAKKMGCDVDILGDLEGRIAREAEAADKHSTPPISERMHVVSAESEWDELSTEAIMKSLQKEVSDPQNKEEQRNAIVAKHHAAQLMLKPLTVQIPYADLLNIPATKVSSRRTYLQMLGIIMSVALLRQKQKHIVNGQIEADLRDYQIAYPLIESILHEKFTPVSERADKLLKHIVKNKDGISQAGFTRNDCVEWSGVSRSEVVVRLKLLVDAGLIERVAGRNGVACRYVLRSEQNSQLLNLEGIPTPAELKKHLEAS